MKSYLAGMVLLFESESASLHFASAVSNVLYVGLSYAASEMHTRLMAAVECLRKKKQAATRKAEPVTKTNTEMTMKVSKYLDSTR